MLQNTLDIQQTTRIYFGWGLLLVLFYILNVILYHITPIDKSLNSTFYHSISVAIIQK